MAVINRCAVAISPLPPLIAWSRRVSGEEDLGWEESDRGLYLLPPYENEAEGWAVLQRVYDTIFTQELQSWCSDESLWPSPRSFELFQQWFDVCFYDLIDDLCDEEITHHRIDHAFLQALRPALLELQPPPTDSEAKPAIKAPPAEHEQRPRHH